MVHAIDIGKIGITARGLGGYMGQLKTNPRMRKTLEDLGYTPEQIPPWVTSTPPPSLTSTPTPAGASKVGVASKIGQSTSKVSNQSGNQSGGQSSTPPPGLIETGGSALGVGSYNRATWMKKEGVVKSGDKYYKLITLADSSTAWKEVEIPPEILAQ